MKLTHTRSRFAKTVRPINRVLVYLRMMGTPAPSGHSILRCDDSTTAKEVVALFLHEALIVENKKGGPVSGSALQER